MILAWASPFKVTYHPLYSMNKFVTNKSKSPQDGAQVLPYMGSHDSQSPHIRT